MALELRATGAEEQRGGPNRYQESDESSHMKRFGIGRGRLERHASARRLPSSRAISTSATTSASLVRKLTMHGRR